MSGSSFQVMELPGWSFTVVERSAGVWEARGQGPGLSSVSRTGDDHEALVREIKADAADLTKRERSVVPPAPARSYGEQLKPRWAALAEAFVPDGALRDIYLLDADAPAWREFVRLVVDRWPHELLVGGERREMPADPSDLVLRAPDQALALLRFWVGGMQVNCHFFDMNEIELDIDPADVTEATYDALLDLVSILGDTLDRDVLVTHENASRVAVPSGPQDTSNWPVILRYAREVRAYEPGGGGARS